MKNNRYIALILLIAATACQKFELIESGIGLEDWSTTTHSNSASPNYDVVFNQYEVNRIDIEIEPEYWAVMQQDLEDLYGGTSGGPPGAFADENPIYVKCQVYHNDRQWYDVGIRYKGNSSLRTTYQQGKNKLPFRLEFNHFEDENPAIFGQTFYGFQQLALANNFQDNSLIREKVGADLFRAFGVPAAQTAFYRVYIDFGEGSTYFGLYTMTEIVFDTMIETQFTGGGNCYKPDADGAYLNNESSITSEYISNKTGGSEDLDELRNLVAVITSSDRTTNPATWRSNLEAIFDVDQYLKYLAVNQTMCNWDTYGIASHNFYLYTNPSDGRLNWIPWDNNECLTNTGPRTPLEFDFSNMANNRPGQNGSHTWPMIDHLYNDPVYRVQYEQYIDEFLAGPFATSSLSTRISNAHSLIEPYVTGLEGEDPDYTLLPSLSDFTMALSDMQSFIATRWNEADAYTP